MKLQDLHKDEAVLAELGRRLAQVRIGQNISQAELAQRAGVGKRTLERVEAGETTQTRTLFRILRELGLLAQLDALLPEPKPRPRDVIREDGRLPRRAGRKKPSEDRRGEWKWGDEA
ncbi:MAG TPA: helix-turn-helix domain-containing protein [Kiritimatiellia bacterium]|nr:helix-turn-helix domain-containing protein [Kiritimatiellia bacterium]